MKALALLRLSLTVSGLERLGAFYTGALGFQAKPAQNVEPALAALLGARRIRTMLLLRGRQSLELAEFDPPGASYPADSRSNDCWFQHAALVTDDIGAAYAKLGGTLAAPITRRGPQALPGGLVAYKFRDGDRHPLELIQFPLATATAGGIDHSAIVVADAGRSIAFYGSRLGLTVAARQVNTGPAQDALDDLRATSVEVVALSPSQPAPHLELLGYGHPKGRLAPPLDSADVAASRLVFRVDSLAAEPGAVTLADGTRAALLHDPDGHALLLLDAP